MATNISFSTYGFMNGILILSEENWRTFFKPFITDSVQSGLATIAGANMTVYVSAGECRCGAVMGILDEMIALDVANGDSTYNRIDSVIVQYTYGEPSTLAVAIVQGTPSANPVPPTLTKVYDTLWQMEIAQILVPSGATSSSEFTITDKRVIYESIESIIDDNTESEERVWSSQKTHEEIVSLSSEIYDSLNTKADAITRTASGDIVTITDGADNIPVTALSVAVDPVQDLHGYDSPWPAGGGKNILPLTLDAIKTYNGNSGDATYWDGNVYHRLGIVYTFETYQGYITKIIANGTASGNATLVITADSTHNEYVGKIFSGCPSGGGGSSYSMGGYDFTTGSGTPNDSGSGFTLSGLTDHVFRLYAIVVSGYTANNVTFQPMIRDSSQSATYVPYSNICPISGFSSANITRSGKNILPNNLTTQTQHGITATVATDGKVTLSGTGDNVSYAVFYLVGADNSYPLLLKAGTYVLSQGVVLPNGCFMRIWSASGLVARVEDGQMSKQFTITKDTYVQCYVFVPKNADFTTTKTVSPMIRLASDTDSSYESPHIQTITVDLNGTRYGGTLDVLTGEMTVDRAMFTYNGSNAENWITYNNGGRMESSYYGSQIKRNSSSNTLTGVISNAFQEITPGQSWTASKVGFSINDTNSNVAVSQFVGGGMTVESWKTYLQSNPLTIVTYLATPLTVTLDSNTMSLLLGENNLWADTGDILNLTYPVGSSKSFIDKQIAESQIKTRQMITIVTDQMIAPNNLNINDIIVVNDELYKVINSNIASGEAMVIGTNVIKITLAEYIQSML